KFFTDDYLAPARCFLELNGPCVLERRLELQKCHSDCLSAGGATATSAGTLNSESRTHMNPPGRRRPNLAAGASLFSVLITTPSSATLGKRVTNPPCQRKNSAPPWRGFLWPPAFLHFPWAARRRVSRRAGGRARSPRRRSRRRSQQPFAGTNRPDGNCFVARGTKNDRHPQPRS